MKPEAGARIREKNVAQFDRDAVQNRGYLYTQTDRLSSRWANQRLSEAVQSLVDLEGKKVVDLGCGDGTYTLEFLEQKPASLLGLDASQEAIRLARKKAAGRKSVKFQAKDIYEIGSLGRRFDVAVVRGLLHHLYDARKAALAVSKIADEIVVLEPNGYNPVLKMIEKFSPYHVQHEEKSFYPFRVEDWFKESGGRVVGSFYCGLVPFFCPAPAARFLKELEPWVEKTPLLRQLSCAVYAFKVSMRG